MDAFKGVLYTFLNTVMKMNWIYHLLRCGGRRLHSLSEGEGGVVLAFTLVVLLMLTGLALMLLRVAALEPLIATNLHRRNQALGVADAGAERAIAQLLATPSLVNNAPGVCPVSDFSPLALGTGTADVTYSCDGGFATVRIDSTGTTNVGTAQRIVRVVVSTNLVPKEAVLAGGEVEIIGNARIEGSKGGIHGNGEVKVTGSGFVEQVATSSSSECEGCTDPSHVGMPGASGPNVPAQAIPTVNPQDFVSQADFILRDDAMIYVAVTSQFVPEGSGAFVGWDMQGSGKWRYTGSGTPPDGTYYASREIKITSDPASPENPWKATFIAGTSPTTGTVEIKGTPNIAPYLQDFLIVGGEAQLKENATLAGVVIGTDSDEEVKVGGNVILTGNIIGRGDVMVSRDATIIYKVGTRTPLIGPLRVLSWTVTPGS